MLHNNNVDWSRIRDNLEESIKSSGLMMMQNSGRAGQFAGQFLAQIDSLDRVNKILADKARTDNLAKAREAKANKE